MSISDAQYKALCYLAEQDKPIPFPDDDKIKFQTLKSIVKYGMVQITNSTGDVIYPRCAADWYRNYYSISDNTRKRLAKIAEQREAKAEKLKTRKLGYCPICERDIKLDGRDKLVHHGYERPGYGYIVGDCLAVYRDPYEVNCDVVRDYRDALTARLDECEKTIRRLKRKPASLKVTKVEYVNFRRVNKVVTVKKGDDLYERERENLIRERQYEIRNLKREVERCDKLIAEWKPQPIRTWEEEEQKLKAEKAARKAKKMAEKQAKIDKKVASFRKRIDSAQKNRKPWTLSDIWDSIYRNFTDYTKLSHRDALALIDRNDVWRAYGLVDEAGIPISREEADKIRSAMRRKKFNW